MKILDLKGRLAVHQAGRITLIGPKASIVEARTIPGTNVVVLGGNQALDDLRDWLRGEELNHAAKALGISRSAVGRMRQRLGLSAKYARQSRTTAWRKKHRKGDT